jgi:hypothetical protein
MKLTTRCSEGPIPSPPSWSKDARLLALTDVLWQMFGSCDPRDRSCIVWAHGLDWLACIVPTPDERWRFTAGKHDLDPLSGDIRSCRATGRRCTHRRRYCRKKSSCAIRETYPPPQTSASTRNRIYRGHYCLRDCFFRADATPNAITHAALLKHSTVENIAVAKDCLNSIGSAVRWPTRSHRR